MGNLVQVAGLVVHDPVTIRAVAKLDLSVMSRKKNDRRAAENSSRFGKEAVAQENEKNLHDDIKQPEFFWSVLWKRRVSGSWADLAYA